MASRFEVLTHSDDGRRVVAEAGDRRTVVDLSAALGGPGEHPNPDETLLSALGACTIITLRLYAARKGWDLGAIRVRVTMDVPGGDAPNRIEQVVHIENALDREQSDRLTQIAGRCPIHRILSGPNQFEDRLGTADEVGAVA